jgi:hypothetical protein
LPTYYKRKHHIIPNITYDIIPDIIPDIMPDIFDIFFSAGLCVSCRPIPFPEPLDEFNVTSDFDITGAGDVLFARQQLLFKCTLCSTGEMGNTRRHKEFSLIFFSTFEPISLTPASCMQQKGVPMLY